LRYIRLERECLKSRLMVENEAREIKNQVHLEFTNFLDNIFKINDYIGMISLKYNR